MYSLEMLKPSTVFKTGICHVLHETTAVRPEIQTRLSALLTLLQGWRTRFYRLTSSTSTLYKYDQSAVPLFVLPLERLRLLTDHPEQVQVINGFMLEFDMSKEATGLDIENNIFLSFDEEFQKDGFIESIRVAAEAIEAEGRDIVQAEEPWDQISEGARAEVISSPPRSDLEPRQAETQIQSAIADEGVTEPRRERSSFYDRYMLIPSPKIVAESMGNDRQITSGSTAEIDGSIRPDVFGEGVIHRRKGPLKFDKFTMTPLSKPTAESIESDWKKSPDLTAEVNGLSSTYRMTLRHTGIESQGGPRGTSTEHIPLRNHNPVSETPAEDLAAVTVEKVSRSLSY